MYPQLLSGALASELVCAGEFGYVIDGFSGSGIIGSSCLSIGADVLSFEIKNDSKQDMLSRGFASFLGRQCELKNVRSVMLPIRPA